MTRSTTRALVEEVLADPLIIARFWSRVSVGRPGVCWEWQERSRNESGYGIFRPTRSGQVLKAHRVALSIVNGEPVGEGLVVRHSCDNPPCCNPRHLSTGTQSDNIRDAIARGRRHYPRRIRRSDVAEMRALVSAGESATSVAQRFGISTSYTSRLLNGTNTPTL